MPSSKNKRAIYFGVYPALVMAMNLLIVARLFRVDYTSYLESNEGSFVAIARQVAEHPWHYIVDRGWWPLWSMGFPFEFSYLPGLHIIVGLYSRFAGISAGLAFHQVCALFYALAPATLYLLAYSLTKRVYPSLIAATLFSLISPCAFLVPGIATDIGGLGNLRRLQILAYYGEGPHTATIAILPLAMLFLYLAMTRRRFWMCVCAGVFAALTVVLNAFGATLLVVVCLALLLSVDTSRVIRNALLLGVIGALAYVWISPLMPPAVIKAIQLNSPTVGGDYAFSRKTLLTWAIIANALFTIRALTRKWSPEVRFFALYTAMVAGIVLLAYGFDLYAVPQPHRYQTSMDLGLCLTAVFGAVAIFENSATPQRVVRAISSPLFVRIAAVVLIALTAYQLRHGIRYARGLIRFADVTQTAPYRMAKWADANLHGQRAMISGAWGFHFNAFTDTPQLYGGHDPMQPNITMRVAAFTIYSGMNAGDRDAEYSILWMQAMGTHAVSVPGPQSLEYYKPMQHPRKFEGILPVLWREGDDTIYGVPARSTSLAHIVPEAALVKAIPVNGLDVDQIRQYVAALEDRALPEAAFVWRDLNTADIQAKVAPGQVLSLQVSHDPGWQATSGGQPIAITKDGLGMLVLHPQCENGCSVELHYAGSREQHIAGFGSVALMLVVAGAGLFKAMRMRKG